VTRTDLEQFARANKIRFRQDASNTALDFQRNRIRRELLPLLKTRYQPALSKTVLRCMEIVGTEAEFVADVARQWLERKNRPAFGRLPVAVQRRCLQRQLLRLNLSADFELIECLRISVNVTPVISVHRDSRGVVQVQTYASVAFNPNQLVVALKRRAGEATFDRVRCGWRVEVTRCGEPPERATGCEFFDADKVGATILLRHWRPGDRFQPIGMASPVKLQDWLTNQKVARLRRHELVVATTVAGEIFWVEGLRIGEQFKLTPQTKSRLHWRWHQVNSR